MKQKKLHCVQPYTMILLMCGLIIVGGCSKKRHARKIKQKQQKSLRKNSEQQIKGSVSASSQEQLSKKTDKLERENNKKQAQIKKLAKKVEIKKISKKPENLKNIIKTNELDFEVENLTGKTIYVACFSYLRKRYFTRWRWSKTPVYELKNKESKIMDVATISNKHDKKNIFGFLAVFNNKQEADDATYELLDDNTKLDLDLLQGLKGKKVSIEIEKYGFKEPFLKFDFIDKEKKIKKVKELDFLVKNNTGKTIFICCFAYEKKAKGRWIAAEEDRDDMSVWRFDKTKVLKLSDGQTGMVDVDTIITKRDRKAVLGYLGVFDETEEKLAIKSTYELLNSKKKLHLGSLKYLKNKMVVIGVEKYGLNPDIIEYKTKSSKNIDFSKVIS
jgi:hypothetical protein